MLYSTGIGLLAEHVLTDDDLFYASSWSYLRWLEEEWGFARADRMFVAPIFSMRDVDRTCEQLDYFFERGGKVVAMVPGPALPTTTSAQRSQSAMLSTNPCTVSRSPARAASRASLRRSR